MYIVNFTGASVFCTWNPSNPEHSPLCSQGLQGSEPSSNTKNASTGAMTSGVPVQNASRTGWNLLQP